MKSKPILSYLLMLLVGSGLLSAQQIQRNLLGSRYSLSEIGKSLVTCSDWKPYPSSPAEWRAAVAPAQLELLVKEGEGCLSFKWEPLSATLALEFARNGNRSRFESQSFAKRDALFKLIVAESVEGKGRFTEAIVNGLWSICEESHWGVPAHLRATGLPDVTEPVVDLFSAETATLMALTDYFVGPRLDQVNPLLRKRILSETDRRLFVPMLTRSDAYAWMSKTVPVNNWNPWINSNWLAATLFLEKDPARRALMVHRAMLGLDRYLNSLGDSGGCDEGPGYWSAAGASTFDCLELLSAATKGRVDIFSEPLVANMGAYIHKAHIAGDYYINFADAGPKTHPDGLMVWRFGQAVHDPQLVRFGLWLQQGSEGLLKLGGWQKCRKLSDLLTSGRLPSGDPGYSPSAEVWIPDVQVMTARSRNGLFVGTHGGHNAESHNHNDVGDFVIYCRGEPIIVDVGSGTYTSKTFSDRRYELWYTQSNYHNLPVINGCGQSAGRQFGAKDVFCELAPSTASLSMDIGPAFPREAGVRKWQRRVTLGRTDEFVELADSYELEQVKVPLRQSFMTVAKFDLSVPGRIAFEGKGGARLLLLYDPTLWEAGAERPPHEGPDYGSIEGKWEGAEVHRITLTSRHLQQAGKHAFRFQMP